jgi:hypothetical protein
MEVKEQSKRRLKKGRNPRVRPGHGENIYRAPMKAKAQGKKWLYCMVSLVR